MLMKSGFIALALVASVAAQADIPRPTPVAGENLIGYTVDTNGITFQVHSGGCTSKESFGLTTGLARGPADGVVHNVTLVRTAPDYCEAYLPYGTNVTFTWAEICLRNRCEHVVVKNSHAAIRPYFER